MPSKPSLPPGHPGDLLFNLRGDFFDDERGHVVGGVVGDVLELQVKGLRHLEEHLFHDIRPHIGIFPGVHRAGWLRGCVDFLDGFSISSDEVRWQLQEFQPDYIRLSIRNIDDMVKGSTHSYIPGILETYLAPIKEQSRAVLILGGSGFTIFPDELMTVFGADFGITGEAEEAFPLLLQALELGGDPSQIEGVVLPGKKVTGKTRPSLLLNAPFSSDLDTLLNYAPYSERGAYPIQTKRGCVQPVHLLFVPDPGRKDVSKTDGGPCGR